MHWEFLESHSDLIAGVFVAVGFCARLWLAHATFFNTDEAWHYSVANQSSLSAAYKASLTLAHPPLMVFVLYFWRYLGTSDVMLRLPGVVAGTVFCWIFYKWLSLLFGRTVALCGAIFAALLPPMIALSSEVRQYSGMLMFAVASAYFLERALAKNSAHPLLSSSLCLWLAMLSHYSAFLFAAALGVYCIVRMAIRRPSLVVIGAWAAGQLVGVALAAFLYLTHIARLGSVYVGAQPLHRFGDFYIADWYFHPGRDHLLPFLYRGTFGLFRFTFGQTAVAQVLAILFFAGVVMLFLQRTTANDLPPPRVSGFLLLFPFLLNWAVVIVGLYPYGRTRQCIYLGVFALAGTSYVLTQIARNKPALAAALAVAIVAACQIWGTAQGRDMLPFAEQRRAHMDQAIQFLHTQVTPADLLFLDEATSYQIKHYLCRQQPPELESPVDGFESYHCGGLRIVSTASSNRTLTPDARDPVPEFRATLLAQWQNLERSPDLKPGASVWVVQGGWGSRLGESLKQDYPQFARIEPHSFGRYLNVFKLPLTAAPTEHR